jgi:hypothetical protein
MKNWEVIADTLSKAGFSLGWVSAVDLDGRAFGLSMRHGDSKEPQGI